MLLPDVQKILDAVDYVNTAGAVPIKPAPAPTKPPTVKQPTTSSAAAPTNPPPATTSSAAAPAKPTLVTPRTEPTDNQHKRWARSKLVSECLPIAPPDAKISRGSSLRPGHLGKIPAVQLGDGTWSGLPRWTKLTATPADVRTWWLWKGSGLGLQTRIFTAADGDIDDGELARAVEELARDYLGVAPVRRRKGSARFLLLYRTPEGHPPIRKRRLAWTDADGCKGAFERLGAGQQCVVLGSHPKGGEHEWPEWHPCDTGPEGLTEVDEETWKRFFEALEKLLTERGCTIDRGAQAAEHSVLGKRKSLDEPSLWAPSHDVLREALRYLPNTPDNFPSHNDFVAITAAIKAAAGPNREAFYPDFLDWALEYPGIDEDYIRGRWESVT
jgi:hypothetical protein